MAWAQPMHTTHITHTWAGCNSEELRGIRMSEFSSLLLEKWAMTGSLSQNPFCQLQVKGEWLTILESLKKKLKIKKKKKRRFSYELKQPNKGAFTNLKGYIYLWFPSGALASNFSRCDTKVSQPNVSPSPKAFLEDQNSPLF